MSYSEFSRCFAITAIEECEAVFVPRASQLNENRDTSPVIARRFTLDIMSSPIPLDDEATHGKSSKDFSTTTEDIRGCKGCFVAQAHPQRAKYQGALPRNDERGALGRVALAKTGCARQRPLFPVIMKQSSSSRHLHPEYTLKSSLHLMAL